MNIYPHQSLIYGMENDTRGWVMSIISGVGTETSFLDWRIQDSENFLASSLSLSFGVMIFSALFNILPHSKSYLIKGGNSSSEATCILLAGFLGGFTTIQVISRFVHNHTPSHVVDCDHLHEENLLSHGKANSKTQPQRSSFLFTPHDHEENQESIETSPLISPRNTSVFERPKAKSNSVSKHSIEAPSDRKNSLLQVQSKVISFVKDTKQNCESDGPCFGYSELCGQNCFKNPSQKSSLSTRTSTLTRSYTKNPTIFQKSHSPTRVPTKKKLLIAQTSIQATLQSSGLRLDEVERNSQNDNHEVQHHHHVPENAFLSIGLQTSIAIALHKLPEGFMTYATNHANPSLGFSVFIALFLHNITEGFALALPLYLALNSRKKAIIYASILGGVSQPLGAGIAAGWIRVAGHQGYELDSGLYGCMFAITAGIMTSVAMQLFVEGLSLNHRSNLCMSFGCIGMCIMCLSNALTS
ncbi:BgtA-21472 [Blumeria graminis f. sp. tritici]|uniref:BgtA-21472 n=2 Tax=Blumeria graminis f. sp. tritici TaxID=62690 RepID=A0A9X9QH17_BLUGR|nr:hypothetical protein BGT96224_A21472 [Blumeria graminis f. sp. tritici 96224]VDB96354.1 BgtA-21472 [Blumeria graminis f. sp. tritici]